MLLSPCQTGDETKTAYNDYDNPYPKRFYGEIIIKGHGSYYYKYDSKKNR